LTIQREEVHLWWAFVDREVLDINYYYQILSIDEKNRVARNPFKKQSDIFIVAHGLLRAILSRYLKIDPQKICFIYEEFGKPGLDLPFKGAGLSFNLSHSKGIVLYAITRDREIGVDIEYIPNSLCLEKIAEICLSPREMKMFCLIPLSDREKIFLDYWTCKEAYIKATGLGHSVPLSQVEVILLQNKPEVQMASRFIAGVEKIWSLQRVESPQGYSAALAVEGNDYEIKNYLWPNPVNSSLSLKDIF
jgi:4'-phosphopantetheinyl transferase